MKSINKAEDPRQTQPMNATEAAAAAGVTRRQLQHWRNTGILRPDGWILPKDGHWKECRYSDSDVMIAAALGRVPECARRAGLRRVIPSLRLAVMKRGRYLAFVFTSWEGMTRVKILDDEAAVVKYAAAVPGAVVIVEIPQ